VSYKLLYDYCSHLLDKNYNNSMIVAKGLNKESMNFSVATSNKH